jgi:hypothetical protein
MNNELKNRAEIAKMKYKNNLITREEAKKEIQPFIDYANKKAVELAKKYNQKPRKISFIAYVR